MTIPLPSAARDPRSKVALQADMATDDITWGDHYAVQPANLNLIKLELTGQQIYDPLNQQWSGCHDQGHVLQMSEAVYTVTVNEYLTNGGGTFTVLRRAGNPVFDPFVADALHQYVRKLPQPLKTWIDGRICRLP